MTNPPREGFENYLKNEAYIRGDLYLYLEDGTIIHCIDRKIYGYVDDTSSALYYLTYKEVEQLKKSSIARISYCLEAGIGSKRNYSATTEQGRDTTQSVKTLYTN